MICRNRIWEELKQAKANIICIQKYTDKRRGYNRAYNGFVAITAFAGALGTLLNDKVPFFASMLIGFVSIIKSVLPNFVQGESELSSLDVLADFYNKYMNSLENIWYRLDHDQKNKNKMGKDYTTKDLPGTVSTPPPPKPKK